MHVLFLPSSYPTAAAPRSGSHCEDQALALSMLGVNVGVCYPDLRSLRTLAGPSPIQNHFQWTCTDEREVHVVQWHGWNVPSARVRAGLFIEEYHRAYRIYERRFGRPDVIHAQNALWGGVAAMQLSAETGVPFLVTEHSSDYPRHLIRPWEWPWVERCFRASSVAVCVSPFLAGELHDALPEVSFSVIPNMVDTDFFVLPSTAREKSRPTFLAVCGLNRNKGIDVLLEAFALYRQSEDCWSLEIGGDGPLREELSRQVTRLHLEESVKFLGPLTRLQVREAMWRGSALIISSRVETFGIVAIEALATGLPVIATRCGGPESILTPDDGLLVEADDSLALASALEAITRTAASFAAEDLRERCVKRFGSAGVGRQLLDLYAHVVRWQEGRT
jgi:glycosyltransferase involved in cell wall biosynthesis